MLKKTALLVFEGFPYSWLNVYRTYNFPGNSLVRAIPGWLCLGVVRPTGGDAGARSWEFGSVALLGAGVDSVALLELQRGFASSPDGSARAKLTRGGSGIMLKPEDA